MQHFIFLAFLCFFVILASPGQAAAEPFAQWLSSFRQEALQRGISQNTLDKAFANIRPIPRVIELDRKQPEKSMGFAQYKERVINKARIEEGQWLLHKHRDQLQKISSHYGVPAEVIVALWGMETSYGNNTGGFDVIPALATLAHEGRRAKFFRDELIKALQIIDEGHISADKMKGSWAGAMGQNQFMPSSFHNFAVDGNNDGRRDIWNSLPDVFASTANYLSKSGWKKNESWGMPVKVPGEFPASLAGLDTEKSVQQWKNMGVTANNGSQLPDSQVYASLVIPDGGNGAAFLVYDNYRVIMKWNKSVYFASSVGMLSDAIKQ